MKKRILGVALLLVSACKDTVVTQFGNFSSPEGIVVAGVQQKRLFVASSSKDVVQVVNLPSDGDLRDIKLVESPSLYFPLRIAVGVQPERLAATADGNFVLVLDGISGLIAVIDAESLKLVEEAGSPWLLQLGDAGFGATDLVSRPQGCLAPCLGQFYVATAVGVFEIEANAVNNSVQLDVLRTFDVGGQPHRLAVSAAGFLFATFANSSQVARVDLTSGIVELRDAGALTGPLAVSSDSSTLIVGRPAFRDLLLFDDADGSGFAARQVPAAAVPHPVCLNVCGASPQCDNAHPSSQALCVNATGDIEAVGAAYGGMYLGVVPAEIATVGFGAAQRELKNPCVTTSDTSQERNFEEYALIASVDGTIRFVGIRGFDQLVTAPELVVSNWCLEPSVDATDSARYFDLYMESCPNVDATLAQFVCVRESESTTSGVILERGASSADSWTFEWEGVPSKLDRQDGGGAIDNNGYFVDLGQDFEATDVRAGDLLEITSSPQATPACLAKFGATPSACQLEFRVAEVLQDGGATKLRLVDGSRLQNEDPSDDNLPADDGTVPVPRECFREGGVIGYRVRTGGSFLVRYRGREERLKPGQRYGLGGEVGRDQPILFRLRSFGTAELRPTCERYDEDGIPIGDVDPFLRRDVVFGFRVNDAYSPVVTGFDTGQSGSRSVGFLPGGSTVTQLGENPTVFFSYSGSNSLLGLVPTDTTSFGTSRYAILR